MRAIHATCFIDDLILGHKCVPKLFRGDGIEKIYATAKSRKWIHLEEHGAASPESGIRGIGFRCSDAKVDTSVWPKACRLGESDYGFLKVWWELHYDFSVSGSSGF